MSLTMRSGWSDSSTRANSRATADTWSDVHRPFSAEYKWTIDYIRSLTFLQQHLYLDRLLRRRRLESGAKEEGDVEELDTTDDIAGFFGG